MTAPRKLLAAWGLHPKKQLGQYFLSDPSTAETIVVRSGIHPDDVVLEIGAGLGALTLPLARHAKKVFAVETDRQLTPLLKTELLVHGASNVLVLEKNIRTLDFRDFAADAGKKIILMGNLPYNLSTVILIQLVQSREAVNRAVFMLQKELAMRIIAPPGGRDYGRLSVMLQYCSEIKRIAVVRAPLFHPKPRVDSEVIEIRIKAAPTTRAVDETFLFGVIKAAFGKRRKTLKNALGESHLPINGERAQEVLEIAGIDPARRAETLDVDEFVKLSNALYRISSATDSARSHNRFT